LAVELFFVISGFYMQMVLANKYTKKALGKRWISQFYIARYFRLFPTYICVFILVVVAALIKPTLSPLPIWNIAWSLPNTLGNLSFKLFLLITNFTMLFQDFTMFLSVQGGNVELSGNFRDSSAPLWEGLAIPQAWSLGIELSFYIIAPFLLNLRSQWLIIGLCCSLIFKVILVSTLHLQDPWTYRFFPFEVGYFLLGAMAFRSRTYWSHIVSVPTRKYLVYFVYPIVVAITVCSFPIPIAYVWYPLVLACLLPFIFQATSNLKFDRLIGELSYPFYISHVFSIVLAGAVVKYFLHTSEHSIAWIGLGLTLCFAATGLILETILIEPWRAQIAERHSGHSLRVTEQAVAVGGP
jgi:peptidoglycan/LPS O-acetylase OafA/YrhL